MLESARKRGSTKERYEDFFRRLRYQIESKGIKQHGITNMDEHGMQEQETIAGTVIGDSLTGRALVESPNSTTWVTVIEAVTAEARRLTPVVIFTGASLQGQWYPPFMKKHPVLKTWKYDYSATGWSNEQIALKWLNEVYLPETKPRDPQEWRLLILDKHSTHKTDEFIITAFKNKVQLLYLPPHTSHKVQPLDRSVFGPLKEYFRQETRMLAHARASATANKQRFLLAYVKASKEGVRSSNIRSGFRKTGIWPINQDRILEDPKAVIGDSPPPPKRDPTPKRVPISDPNLLKTP